MPRTLIPSPRVCVGTKRGKNYGLVYAPDGTVIGRVFRDCKVARAALGGGRRSFFTANVIVDGVECGGSLGTRHETRRSAVNAILAFYASYPVMHVRRIAFQAAIRGDLSHDRAFRRVMACAAAQFKYDNWQACALSVRNLPDPRASRWHIPVAAQA